MIWQAKLSIHFDSFLLLIWIEVKLGCLVLAHLLLVLVRRHVPRSNIIILTLIYGLEIILRSLRHVIHLHLVHFHCLINLFIIHILLAWVIIVAGSLVHICPFRSQHLVLVRIGSRRMIRSHSLLPFMERTEHRFFMLLFKTNVRSCICWWSIVQQRNDLLLPKQYLNNSLPLLLIQLHLTATRPLNFMTGDIRGRINMIKRGQIKLRTLLLGLILILRLLHLLLLFLKNFINSFFQIIFEVSFRRQFPL